MVLCMISLAICVYTIFLCFGILWLCDYVLYDYIVISGRTLEDFMWNNIIIGNSLNKYVMDNCICLLLTMHGITWGYNGIDIN